MKKEGKIKALKMLGKIAEMESGSKSGIPGWPPQCVGIIYQPKRPNHMKKDAE